MKRKANDKTKEDLIKYDRIGGNRAKVYLILFKHGPLTGTEVSTEFNKDKSLTSKSETVRNRITELVKMGLVEIVQSVQGYSGTGVNLYDVTDRAVPIPLQKESVLGKTKRENKSMREALREVIANGKSRKFKILADRLKL